jgi:maltose alpha-D-glucosyltransferase/alpha-amylase
MAEAGAALWYKDAVIYQLHVKTFLDGNGDGIGDFPGLTSRLDYIAGLGATCIWLLPFYESPLRDDGYDIAHYERVHKSYGTLADFRTFLHEAHARGLRVITELVINHTSDQHPWFQAARHAPPRSPKRDFYVWSDTDARYAGARVIFSDAEPSNWTWDPAAGQFYWHRFFRHQPDLNFDNPHVRLAVLKVMRFWLDMGVDGLRLDAIAHLFEREGTSCDHLPETHAFLREVRAEMDARYGNRVLLAEANGPPAVIRRYLGADQCHMAFNFPLLPRLFLALETGAAAPIVDAVGETADLPDACQWAVFLRNHDELSLSALTPEQRAPLLRAFAPDPRMLLHGDGIRRRLAPLLGNDRRRIELAFGLLLALPGTPIIYYGDEIGMGDNLALDDRDGVRTPMQWDAGRHGGFSAAAAPALVLPPNADAGGYPAVNVEAQSEDSQSLLAAVKRLIAERRAHPAFGRGTIQFLNPDNPHVLAFIRRHEDDAMCVVANLCGAPQPAVVPWPAAATVQTLAPYACEWFDLAASSTAAARPAGTAR